MVVSKKLQWVLVSSLAAVGIGSLIIVGCSSGLSAATTASTGTTGGSGTTTAEALNANQTSVTSVTTSYGGTCEKVTRDTTSCQSARTALGLSGDWLNFSCNVTLGLATAGGAATTTYSSAAYVTVTIVDLPDHTSNYFPTTGTYDFTANSTTVSGNYSSMYSAYSTTFPDPSTISTQSITMNIPISPSFSGSQTMAGGVVGVSIDGVVIYDDLASNTDNIFAEAGSFDQCQGHPAMGQYHYHSEPYAISYNDNNLIGVMRDGFFIYGRQDHDGTTPGSTANLESAGTASTIYKYGGHTGTDPLLGTGSTFHYHLTEWVGCYHESGGTKSTDDGETDDSFNTTPACAGSWVDAWFMTGHGNGGAFMSTPSGLSGQTPSQSTPGIRYYYGTPGTCTGC